MDLGPFDKKHYRIRLRGFLCQSATFQKNQVEVSIEVVSTSRVLAVFGFVLSQICPLLSIIFSFLYAIKLCI